MTAGRATTTYVMRLKMADRPGALAEAAARIAAVRGDLVGIEILERTNGEVIDELIVQLPDVGLLDVMCSELAEVDQLEIESIGELDAAGIDPQLTALEIADVIVGAATVDDLLWSLCAHTRRVIRSDWACVLDGAGTVIASSGSSPHEGWLVAFVAGRAEEVTDGWSGEAEWMPLPVACGPLTLVLGRAESPLRAKERQRAAALARVAGSWCNRLREQSRQASMLVHPSGAFLPLHPAGTNRGWEATGDSVAATPPADWFADRSR
ncbi:MAG: hypothetical protein AAF467_01890 [Actinomycetota bacterium]